MFFCVVTLAWPLEKWGNSFQAEQKEQPRHCSPLDTPCGEEAAQLERPPSGSLFASGLFWARILTSPKPGAFGGGLLMTQARLGEGDAAILVL